MIKFRCSHCSHKILVRTVAAGRLVRCPECRCETTVPPLPPNWREEKTLPPVSASRQKKKTKRRDQTRTDSTVVIKTKPANVDAPQQSTAAMTDKQRKALCEFMHIVYVAISTLVWESKSRQADDLADAVAELPHLLYGVGSVTLVGIRERLDKYQEQHHVGNRYVSMLDDIAAGTAVEDVPSIAD